MNGHAGLVSLIITLVVAALMVGSCVLIHYETLRTASVLMRKLTIRPRARILFVMAAAFVAHSLEVWFCALIFFVIGDLAGMGGMGDIAGTFAGGFYDYLYFSTVSYTSLGIGDLYPTGVLQLLTGVESLIGLVMIAWTGSFTYLAMEKFWSLHRTRTD
ncbi:MAG: two pore domain potassium channel family protein [Alphaproteobacteria bacterium]|nr:two pore domain potassium channel family protein [Alphaproteobacteria bacterium]